jgi:elongation factor G
MAAGSLAFREAVRQAAPVLLEPIMKLEVVVIPEHMGDVLSDLNRRRVVVEGIEDRGNTKVITGCAPLVELFGYTTTLRSLTQGRGTASLEPLDFRPVPAQLAAALMKK